MSAGTTGAHVSGRDGGSKGEGRSWGEGRERAVQVRPPPCPLVASHSTSGDLYVKIDSAVTMCGRDTFAILWLCFICFPCAHYRRRDNKGLC